MKPNTYLLGFGALLAFLAVSHFFVIIKYFQLLIHQTIYFCQTITKELYLQVPGNFGRAIIGILAVALFYTLAKIIMTIIKIYAFRKTLVKTVSQGNIDFIDVFNKLELNGNVTIIDQSIPQAFCFGIVNPKIYISTGLVGLMNKKELEVILRHEKYHLDNRDSLVFLLATIVESLFSFFPVLSDFIRVYRTDREVQADKMAIRKPEDRRSLTEVLKKLLRYEPSPRLAFIAGIFSEDALEARIHSLLRLKTVYRKVSIKNILLSIVSLGVLIGLMVNPVNAIELHDQGQDVVIVCNRYSPVNFSSQY